MNSWTDKATEPQPINNNNTSEPETVAKVVRKAKKATAELLGLLTEKRRLEGGGE